MFRRASVSACSVDAAQARRLCYESNGKFEMIQVRRDWLTVMAAAAFVFGSGCAGTQERESPWPSLPSPWSTLKNTPPRSATAANAALPPVVDAKTAAKPRTSTKGRATKEDGSVAMAMLNGMNHERTGEWNKAREVYEEIRKKEPENVEAAHRLGIVADNQRRHAEAEQLFLFALEREPRNAAILADLGYCYYLQGQLAKAESALTKATHMEPANHRFWNNLGLAIGHQGRYEEALDCFRKSGSEADAQYNLAFIYAAQERVVEAKRSFQTALANDPTHRRAREALASFEEYERLPKDLRDVEDDLVVDGVKYVPYIEGVNPKENEGAVANTSYTASRVARALHQESRGMLNRNMASQRSDEMAKE
jgi:tetratricopeptide (TPR) repeat protein